MLIPQIANIARQVFLNVGGDTSLRREGVEAIVKIARNCVQPDAMGNASQHLARFLQEKRTDQTMGR